MTRWFKRLSARAQAKWRDESGNSTIEFVILFPMFLALLCSAAESGTLMMRQVMLDRGLDIAVRAVRLNTWATVTADNVRGAICDSVVAIPDCENAIVIDMRQIDKGASLPSGSAPCLNSGVSASVATGKENQMMLVRACAVFDPITPTFGLGLDLAKDSAGKYALVASSAFVVEPE